MQREKYTFQLEELGAENYDGQESLVDTLGYVDIDKRIRRMLEVGAMKTYASDEYYSTFELDPERNPNVNPIADWAFDLADASDLKRRNDAYVAQLQARLAQKAAERAQAGGVSDSGGDNIPPSSEGGTQ